MLLAILLLMQSAPTEEPSAAPSEITAPEPLWQQIRYGMTPAEVAAVLATTSGIKTAKPRGGEKISISYVDDGIPIAGIPFMVTPVFENGALSSLALSADDLCANSAQAPIDAIIEGLTARHESQPSRDPDEASNVQRALLASYSTGQPVQVGNAIVGATVATSIILTVRSDRPDYYTGTSRGLLGSLGALSNSMSESRRDQCGGHGFERVGILLVYQRKSDFQKGIEEYRRANQNKREEVRQSL